MPISLRLDGVALAMLIVLSALWGGSFVFHEVILTELPVMTLVALRVVIAALALWVFLGLRGDPIPRSGKVWAAFAFMGFANNAVPFTLIVWGQTEISAGLASIFNATTPIFAAVLAGLLLADEQLTARKLLGLVLALCGVAVLVGAGALRGIGDALLPQLAVLGAALSYGVALVFSRRFARWGVAPSAVALGQLTASSLMMAPLALAIDGVPRVLPSALVIGNLLGLAVFATAGAYILYFSIVRRAGATNAALVTVLVPLFASGLGVLVLGEAVRVRQVAGLALIILGFVVLQGWLGWRGLQRKA